MLTITQSNKAYIMEFNGQRLILLNGQALVWHLKKHAGLNVSQVASIQHLLLSQSSVQVEIKAA